MQPSSERAGNRTVLLADDDEDSLRVSRAILEYHGYRVLTATDGQSCLELARDERPDVIIMDLWMPALDGLEATRQLKSDPDLSHIVVIAVSAYVVDGTPDQAMEAGCAKFMAKPVEPMAMVTEVKRYIG